MTYDRIPIGRFSEITRLSKKALYCYEEKGLLIPVEKDICTGYRYYTPVTIVFIRMAPSFVFWHKMYDMASVIFTFLYKFPKDFWIYATQQV